MLSQNKMVPCYEFNPRTCYHKHVITNMLSQNKMVPCYEFNPRTDFPACTAHINCNESSPLKVTISMFELLAYFPFGGLWLPLATALHMCSDLRGGDLTTEVLQFNERTC